MVTILLYCMSVILSLVLDDVNLYKLCTRLHFIVATVGPCYLELLTGR